MDDKERWFLDNASLEEIKKEIQRRYEEVKEVHFFIFQTFQLIRENPFDEGIVSYLLGEGWKLGDINNFQSSCDFEERLINIEGRLIRQGQFCDFYERDLALMHELNHAWYDRFKVSPYGYGQGCFAW